jgi:hypothetical protein
MPTFVLTYRPPKDYQTATPEGMAAWTAWFQSMGADLLDIGRPVGESTVVGDCGSGSRPLGGYSLIRADDLAAASSVVKGCPFVGVGGGVEVGLLVDLPGTPTGS